MTTDEQVQKMTQ